MGRGRSQSQQRWISLPPANHIALKYGLQGEIGRIAKSSAAAFILDNNKSSFVYKSIFTF